MDRLVAKVKLARRIKTDAYDSEIRDLIEEALHDLKSIGIYGDLRDPLIRRAVRTYCLLSFGQPENYSELKAAYDEQKAQLQMTTGYTDWGDDPSPC